MASGGRPRLRASAPYVVRAPSSIFRIWSRRRSLRAGRESAIGRRGERQRWVIRHARPKGGPTVVAAPSVHVLDDASGAALEHVQRCGVQDPDEAGRVERFARRDRHACVLEQRLSELGGRADAIGGQELRDIGKEVERTGRFDEAQPRLGREPLAQPVPPIAVFVQHFGDAVLRPGQRRFDGALRDRAGIGRRVALQRVAGADHRRRAHRPPAAPPGHRVGLRRAAAEDDAVPHTRGEHRHEVVWNRVVDQLLVTKVDHDPDPAARRLVGDGRHGRLVDQGPGRIPRRVDDDAARARRHRVQERFGLELKAVFGVSADEHRRRLGQLDLLDERRPARHVSDDLVARPEERHDGVEERLFSAGGDDDFRRLIVDAVVLPIAVGDRALQTVGAGVGRVLGEMCVDCRVRGRRDVIRRREIGLAGTEVEDIDPLRLQAHGVRRHLHRRRHGNSTGTSCKHGIRPSLNAARPSCRAAAPRRLPAPARARSRRAQRLLSPAAN